MFRVDSSECIGLIGLTLVDFCGTSKYISTSAKLSITCWVIKTTPFSLTENPKCLAILISSMAKLAGTVTPLSTITFFNLAPASIVTSGSNAHPWSEAPSPIAQLDDKTVWWIRQLVNWQPVPIKIWLRSHWPFWVPPRIWVGALDKALPQIGQDGSAKFNISLLFSKSIWARQ